MDFVDICFLWRKGNMPTDFVADISKKGIIDEVLNDCVLVARIDVRVVECDKEEGGKLVHTAVIERSHWYSRRGR